MKNKKKIIISYLLIILFFNISVSAEKIDYSSNSIKILENGKIVSGEGDVQIIIDDKIFISSEKFQFYKETGIYRIFDNVKFKDNINKITASGSEIIFSTIDNIVSGEGDVQIIIDDKIFISSEKFQFYKETGIYRIFDNVKFKDNINKITASGSEIIFSTIDNKVSSKTKSKINYNQAYDIDFNNFEYDINNQKIKSNDFVKIKDTINNYFELYEFLFEIKNNQFIGKEIKFVDNQQNKYVLKDIMIDTKNNNIYGRDLNIDFNKNLFGNSENDPRIKAKSVKIKDQSSFIKKGVFTSCSKDNDCPPWSMLAEEIEHDKISQTIKYKNAWLKIYDVPTFYFPKFSHPDPTVRRKSGFLSPKFSNSKNIGSSITIPYFHALSESKDITFKPKLFFNNEIVLHNEYRQENKNSSHIADFSILSSDIFSSKNTTKTHFFSNSKFEINNDFFNESNFELNLQNVTNDEYLKIYKIDGNQIDVDNNTLHSYLSLDSEKNDIDFYLSLEVYEDLSKDKQSRHEFIYPNYFLQKNILSEKGNNLLLKSYGSQRKYNTNLYEGVIINDFEFNTASKFTNSGFITNYKMLFKNTNVDARNSNKYKDKFEQTLATIIQYNAELPLKKENSDSLNNFTPKIAFMYSPNKTKNLNLEKRRIDTSNIYSLNRVTDNETVEGGTSITYGAIFNKINKKTNEDILNLEVSSLLRVEENLDLPTSSTIGKKMSDIFGKIEIYPNKNLSMKYDFSIDNNLDKTNYDSISTKFTINKFVTSFEYSDEKNNFINESFTSNSSSFEINKSSSISFNTRRNNEKSATEFYNLIYNYKNDCLTASVKFNKEFYKDSDLKPEKEIFFTLSLIPFGGVTTAN
jgi:LPS-assembly protein